MKILVALSPSLEIPWKNLESCKIDALIAHVPNNLIRYASNLDLNIASPYNSWLNNCNDRNDSTPV